jgi:hypothetical protein
MKNVILMIFQPKQRDLPVSVRSSAQYHLHPTMSTFVRTFSSMECHQYGLFATSTAQLNEPNATEGATGGHRQLRK